MLYLRLESRLLPGVPGPESIDWVHPAHGCSRRRYYLQVVALSLLGALLGVYRSYLVLHLLLPSTTYLWGLSRWVGYVVFFVCSRRYLVWVAYAFHCYCRAPDVFLQQGFVVCSCHGITRYCAWLCRIRVTVHVDGWWRTVGVLIFFLFSFAIRFLLSCDALCRVSCT